MDEAEFTARVVPCVSKLFTSTDRSIRRSLLENIDAYGKHLTQVASSPQTLMQTFIDIQMHTSLAFEGVDLDSGPSAFKTCPAWPEHVQAANACLQAQFALQNADDVCGWVVVNSIHQTLQAKRRQKPSLTSHWAWSNFHCFQTLRQLQTLLST